MDDDSLRDAGQIPIGPAAEALALTRRWVFTTAAAIIFVAAVVAGIVLMIITAAMTAASGSH